MNAEPAPLAALPRTARRARGFLRRARFWLAFTLRALSRPRRASFMRRLADAQPGARESTLLARRWSWVWGRWPRAARPARMARKRRQRRGIAFVLVLGALTILTVMLTEMQDESSAELASAFEARDALLAEYAARSAINLSRLLIASEPTISTAIGPIMMIAFGGEKPQIPVWNFADRMLGPFNDKSASEDFSSFSGLTLTNTKNLGLPGAAFEINIVDEDSKINLNSAARGSAFGQQQLMQEIMGLIGGIQYNPLFERRDPDGNFSDRQAICAAIIDWVDPDQNTMNCDPTSQTNQEMPAEDSYYELLKNPYHRKNAAFDSLEELRRVRGVGDDFWGTFVEPDPTHPEKRLVTVWGQSNAININTASPEMLFNLIRTIAPLSKIAVDPLEMQKFLTITTLMRSFTMGAPPFGSPQAFLNLIQGKGILGPLFLAAGLEPVTLGVTDNQAKELMTTSSKVFSIYATGVVKSGKRETRVRIHEVVDFRGAPPPGQPLAGLGQNPPGQTGTAGAGATAQPIASGGAPNAVQGAAASQQAAIAALTRPSPAGNVVYFKMD